MLFSFRITTFAEINLIEEGFSRKNLDLIVI